MKLVKTAGTTSEILEVFIQDSSKADGSGLTGLTNTSAGLTCYYHRNTAAASVQVNLVTMTVGTFTASGFKEIDSTGLPGEYQLCLPDAVYAAGATSVSCILKGATNMAPLPIEIQLITGNLNNLDAAVSTRQPSGTVVVGSYSGGQDPGTYILSTPANKLATDSSGRTNLNLAQSLPHTGTDLTSGTVGRALQVSRAQAIGKWVVDVNANTLTLYDGDSSTILKVFNITPTGGPYKVRDPVTIDQ